MITLRGLGPAEILVDGEPAPRELMWRKNLAVLAYLARSPDRRRAREHLVGLFWADKPDSAARHSLNEALRVIRRAGGDAVLASQGDQVILSSELVSIDTDLLTECVQREDWESAVTLVRGPFLEGFTVPESSPFEDWLAAERLHWKEVSGEVLRRYAEGRLARGDTAAAHQAAGRGLALDPFSDAAIRVTMLAAALRGERAGALAAFDAYARRLDEELGVAPEPETEELAERIRQERMWRLSDAVPESERWARRLPLVGRERELAAAVEALGRCLRLKEAMLLVVQGESGIGKTRLGEEVAARARLEGAIVARIRAVPSDVDIPWSGLAGLAMGGLLGARGAIRTAPEALAAILPQVSDPDPRLVEVAATADAAPFGRAFAELVRSVASQEPALLWVDQAEYLDEHSALALHAVLRDVASTPCTLLLTAASYPPSESIDELRARIDREVQGCAATLEPLTGGAVERLASLVFPDLGDDDISRLARRIEADSAGLPLFAVELLNAVRLGMELDELSGWPQPFRTMDQTYPGDLPDSVVAAIRIGFRRLSKPAQQILMALAVLEERPDPPLLARATGLGEPDLHDALDELEWHRWLAAESRGYSFVARIVRDVVARDMVTRGQRQRILAAARVEA